MSPSGISGRLREGLLQLCANAGALTWSPGAAVAADVTPPPGFDTEYPAEPDVCVALSTYYVGGDSPTLSYSWIQVQVRTRGARDGLSNLADDLDDAVAQVWLGNWPMTLPNGVRVNSLLRTSGTPIGRDAAGRFERTTNWQFRIYDPGPHRL